MSKRALLIGCNYVGTESELNGCVNDVMRMKKTLISRFGFDEQDIVIMIDTDKKYPQPTGANIRMGLKKIVQNTGDGDFLFVHYSGHGTRIPPESGLETDTGYDECIVPTDMNLLSDHDFRDIVDKVPSGATFSFVADCCHSGGLISHEKEQIGSSTAAGGAIARSVAVKTREFNISGQHQREYEEHSYERRTEYQEEHHGRKHHEQEGYTHRKHEAEPEQCGGYGSGYVRRAEYGEEQHSTHQPRISQEYEENRYERRSHGQEQGRFEAYQGEGYASHGYESQVRTNEGGDQYGGYGARHEHQQHRNEELAEEQHFRRQQQGYSEGYGQQQGYGEGYRQQQGYSEGYGQQQGYSEGYGEQQRQSRFKGHVFHVPNHKEVRNRSMSTDLLMGMFKSSFGAAGGSGIRSSLYSVFGKDSSPMAQVFIGLAISQAPTLLNMLKKHDSAGSFGPVFSVVESMLGQESQKHDTEGGFLGMFGGHKQAANQPAVPQSAGAMGGLGGALMGFLNGHVESGGGNLGSHEELIQSGTPIVQHVASSGGSAQNYSAWKPSANDGKYREDMGILISGCQSAETSADANPDGNPSHAYGALSNAIQEVLSESRGPVTNKDLLFAVRSKLGTTGFQQHPGLYCSDYNATGYFICG